MAVVHFREGVFGRTAAHLLDRGPERFAFLLAGWGESGGEPVLIVRDVLPIPEDRVRIDLDGYEVDPEEVVRAVNAAIRSKSALIEAHSHGGHRPRFSRVPDRSGIEELAAYVLTSIQDRPYGATVWGDSEVYGEYFNQNGSRGVIRSFPVSGAQLRQAASLDVGVGERSGRFDRQAEWFTRSGQRQLAGLRVGIVGAGGTGSHVVQQLAYLGVRDFCVVDPDIVDVSNLNRLVTAGAKDLGRMKVDLASELIGRISPESSVRALAADLRSPSALDALKGVDLVFGCVDNDGARLVLNELAVAYDIPYIDLAVGIDRSSQGSLEAGGRVAVVIPGGPCLYCMDELDQGEAGFFLASRDEQQLAKRRGYVADVRAPAVVSLNASIAAAAVNEFAVWLSGTRPAHPFVELDLIGSARGTPAQWLTPRQVARQSDCPVCALEQLGGASDLNRFARTPEVAVS